MKKLLTSTFLLFLALTLTMGVASGLYETTIPWLMHRHDAMRSAASISSAPSNNGTLWSYTNNQYLASPIVVDGTVITRDSNEIIALDETTGIELWRSSTYTGLIGTLTYTNGRLYIGTNQGYVYCFNSTTGAEIWDYQATTGDIGTSILVSDGKAYFGTTGDPTNDWLHAVDAATGLYEWHYQTIDDILSTPSIDGDLLYFGCENGRVYALNVSGSLPQLKWQFQTKGRVRSIPVVYRGMVIIGSSNLDHSVFAIDKLTGDLIWKYELPSGYIESHVAAADGIVYFAQEAYHNKVYALYANATAGNYTETDPAIRLWSTTLDLYYPTSPIYADGKILLGAYYGVYALDAATGNEIWLYDLTSGASFLEPVVADGRVFAARGVDLHCFGDPYPPVTYPYEVTHDTHTFTVELAINATPGQLDTSTMLTQRKISYTLEGISGTTGMSNITIPHEMLGGPYVVTVDGGLPATQVTTENGTHTSLYFTYLHSSHTVVIEGSTVIPELPSMLILPLMLLASIFAVYLARKKAKF